MKQFHKKGRGSVDETDPASIQKLESIANLMFYNRFSNIYFNLLTSFILKSTNIQLFNNWLHLNTRNNNLIKKGLRKGSVKEGQEILKILSKNVD